LGSDHWINVKSQDTENVNEKVSLERHLELVRSEFYRRDINSEIAGTAYTNIPIDDVYEELREFCEDENIADAEKSQAVNAYAEYLVDSALSLLDFEGAANVLNFFSSFSDGVKEFLDGDIEKTLQEAIADFEWETQDQDWQKDWEKVRSVD